GNGMDSIEAKAVESILHQPVKRVLDEKAAHNGLTEVDRRTPGCCDVISEEAGRVGAQIVSVRPEMIVDDVEVDHELSLMGVVDQGFELIRRAVGLVWREGQHAVIAPVALPGEIIDWHQLDGGDTEASRAVEIR